VVADGRLLGTIWIPIGPEKVGVIYAVAISPDGSTIAAGGWTENARPPPFLSYLFDRESGNLIRRIGGDLPNVTHLLTFSPDGRYLVATLYGGDGLRVFDRDKDWRGAFSDDQYGGSIYGASFSRGGRLVTSSYDGLLRLYRYDPNGDSPNFRRGGEPIQAPSGKLPRGAAFSPDGKRLAVVYHDVVAVDVLDGTTLQHMRVQSPADVTLGVAAGLSKVAWSADGQTLFATGGVGDAQGRALLFAWDGGGLGEERRMTYCDTFSTASGVDELPDGRILVASQAPCVGVMDATGEPVWTITSPILDVR
jgi:WD40 repeat protein